MQTSIFAFATDIREEGVDAVLDNVQDHYGLMPLAALDRIRPAVSA